MKTILIKYGGNAMLSESLQEAVINNIYRLRQSGYRVVLVHGGGPFIKRMLQEADLTSEFIGGHRKTTPEALRYIKMALREVNGNLVTLFNRAGLKAIGLSGADGRMVTAIKRRYLEKKEGKIINHALGQVGDVAAVNPKLPRLLLREDYLPVIACIASDEQGREYNINADMFAGHLAGKLQVSQMLVLTDVDGLMKDIDDPHSKIDHLNLSEIKPLFGKVIKGGMIPKVESCAIAVRAGAESARIINGTQPDNIYQSILSEKQIGTEIC